LDRGHETIASTATVDDRQNASAIPSVTGGLADLHSYPLPWAGDFRARHGELRLADLPARCLLAIQAPVAGLQFGSRPESATGSCKRSTLVHAT
jgi:hypothetical protein